MPREGRHRPTLWIEQGGMDKSNKYRKRIWIDHSNPYKRCGRKKKARVDWEQDEIDEAKERSIQNREIHAKEVREGMKSQLEQWDEYLEKIKKPPKYGFNLKTKMLKTCLDSYKKLLFMDFEYLSRKLGIPQRSLSNACKCKRSLKIDQMIRLCHFLMIPTVEDAYNMNLEPPTFYVLNKRRYICGQERDGIPWDTAVVEMVHQKIVNEWNQLSVEIVDKKNFIQDFKLKQEHHDWLRKKKFRHIGKYQEYGLNRIYLWRVVNNKTIPLADWCFRILFVINKQFGTFYKINDFWRWE